MDMNCWYDVCMSVYFFNFYMDIDVMIVIIDENCNTSNIKKKNTIIIFNNY